MHLVYEKKRNIGDYFGLRNVNYDNRPIIGRNELFLLTKRNKTWANYLVYEMKQNLSQISYKTKLKLR